MVVIEFIKCKNIEVDKKGGEMNESNEKFKQKCKHSGSKRRVMYILKILMFKTLC
jgi:hypothetical protein